MLNMNIDPNFSVFGLVSRREETVSVINHRRTMSVISNEIENATLIDGAQTTIFAGFQYLSRFLAQEARYRQIARRAKQVFVFGVPDVPLPGIENLMYVPLKPTDQLTKEWFLVSFSEQYYTALATEELTSINDPDELRLFKGVWSYQEPIVSILHDWLSDTVGLRRLNYDRMKHDVQSQFALMNHTVERLNQRIFKRTTKKIEETVQQELKGLVKNGLLPSIWELQTVLS